jgi:outer membrane protein assembly factor BamB
LKLLFAALLLASCPAPTSILFRGVQPVVADVAQAQPSPLLGDWTGQIHYGDQSMQLAMHFKSVEKHPLVMLFDIPDMNLHNVGAFPVERQPDGEYKCYIFAFHLSTDDQSLLGTWSFDGHDLTLELKRGEPSPQPPPLPSPGPIAQPAWIFRTAGAIWSSPAAAENAVYFGSNDQNIYALQADSGKLMWQFKTGGAVLGHPTVDGDFLYTLSDDGYLYKLQRRSGKPVWSFNTHSGNVTREWPKPDTDIYDFLTSGATIANGILYIGSADKRLYAVDAESGLEKWHFETQDIVRSTPAIANGLVIFGSRDHNVYALDAKTGALQWKLDTLREVTSSPLVADDTAYIGSRSSDLLALDATTGKVRWKFFYWSSWVESSARMRDGILYVGSSDYQQLFAIDAARGKLVWKFNTDGSAWSTPAVTGKRVYIGAVGVLNYYLIDHHGGFFAVDRISGKVIWRYPFGALPGTPTYGVASSPAVANGLVFFGALDGNFSAFPANE